MLEPSEYLPSSYALQSGTTFFQMASGRDEWASWKKVLKREGKKGYTLARDSLREGWREGWSSSSEKVTSNSDTQDAASNGGSAYDQEVIPKPEADFKYEPLPGEGFIRLLKIVPGNKEEMIRLELSTVMLGNSCGTYESLSYSLHTILTSLRPSTSEESRVLWVDAICINQGDMIERNEQVPIMDRIYQNSWRTVQFLRREPVQSAKRDLYLARMDIWSMLSCEWWYRAWTLQEILLSSSIILIQGNLEIDWHDFCLAVDHGLRMHIWIFLDSGTFVAEEIIPYLSIKSLQLQLGLYGDSTSNRPDFGAEGVLKLLEKCRQRESKDPRDKIYAIFGIIKAVQKMRPPSDAVHRMFMDPDYTNPVVYVYRMLTQQLIEATESLDVLGVCPPSTRRGLPSWVTDWSVSDSFAVPLARDSLDRPRRTHAARGAPARVRFPPDAVTLVLRGHEVTKVKAISEVLTRVHFTLETRESKDDSTDSATGGFRSTVKELYEETHADLHAEASYFHTLLEWERFASKTTAQNPGGGDPQSVYWKTLCAGTYDPSDPSKTEAMYQEWLKVLVNLRNNEKRFGSFSSKINPMIYTMQSISWSVGFPEFTPFLECAIERRFGWCENEWLCLLPEGAQKDDRVVLAEGGKVPLVLRPDGDGYYMFVGEAYIHGIMDGEAFRPDLCQDIKVC
ncbi:hypothetical protein N8I77_004766 [Diaporthe amygdali]|uniref:Heterokaryon incompatibility domain-containing protein n=1 Tax=Phomopsis amygdali TaxID=1214568 RepID=A0AAD9SP46_PHOAM|nr:hypothetical protein N8I77_004766 [Diaporthe amygdali]